MGGPPPPDPERRPNAPSASDGVLQGAIEHRSNQNSHGMKLFDYIQVPCRASQLPFRQAAPCGAPPARLCSGREAQFFAQTGITLSSRLL